MRLNQAYNFIYNFPLAKLIQIILKLHPWKIYIFRCFFVNIAFYFEGFLIDEA